MTKYCTILAALLSDAQVVLENRFSATKFWDIIRQYGVTAFGYMGAMINMLWNQPEKKDDANNPVRVGFGSAAPKRIFADFQKRFNLELVEVYGSTELCVVTNNMEDSVRIGSCGKPYRQVELKIFNENDEELPPNSVGEIAVRPKKPFLFLSGYYKMPEQTLSAIRNLWFHTGDQGYLDEDGYLYFVDRKKDCIRRRGENISSYELEAVLNLHPNVAESAAFPVPSELGEDEVKVAVVLKPGISLSPEALIEFCEDRMPYFAVPRYVEFKGSFPKTVSQRVEKYKLREEGVNENTWDREKAGYKLKR
jgi:crotonobetaine/carnitine-CoA ligase